MIYDFPDTSEPIRQGDIFIGLPRIELSLDEVLLVEETDTVYTTWGEVVANNNGGINIIVPVRPVTAIVATQDCDATRSPDITLCEIREFREVEKKGKDTTSPKSLINLITQHARINQKWFYLPTEDKITFSKKMAVDFMVTLRVPREGLERLRHLRRGRLNQIANEHFRERIGQFFRRYPYNEWYPLNQEELKIYEEKHPDIERYPWQKARM